MSARCEIIGDATLYLGDCREVAPSLQKPAALIGDPPYGQKHKTNIYSYGGEKTYRCGQIGGGESVIAANRRARTGCFTGNIASRVWPDSIHGDSEPFDPLPWVGFSDIVLLWGAHRFADRLPPGQWLVWDKVPTGKVRYQGDGEAAWLNCNGPMRIYRLLWDGVCVGSAARDECTSGQPREHPMQKPVALMEWCILTARVPAGGTIFDPWMGSGSTGIAAARLGYPFVGCEIDPTFFATSCRRIESEVRAPRLPFPERTPEPVQEPLL